MIAKFNFYILSEGYELVLNNLLFSSSGHDEESCDLTIVDNFGQTKAIINLCDGVINISTDNFELKKEETVL